MKTREQLVKNFNSSRSNLLAMIILTSINILLAVANSDLYFLFSANIPRVLFYLGSGFSVTFGIIAAFIAISFYVVCWVLSKNHRGWIVAALAFFIIDALILLWILFNFVYRVDFSLIIELVFFAVIMYHLISGTRAWYSLRKMPPEDEQNEAESATSDLVNKTIPIAQMPLSMPIREASKKGRVLISQNYNNMEIIVKRALGVTELIVNGMVYAEKTGLHEKKTYVLEVNVNDVIINATTEILSMKEMLKDDSLPTVYLYVNGNLLAEKKRYF